MNTIRRGIQQYETHEQNKNYMVLSMWIILK